MSISSNIRLILSLVSLLAFAAPAFASPMGDAFSAYQQARANGDIAGADAAGEKAWQLAEAAHSDKYIAILAYNLAELRARYEPEKDALTPARRAAELAGKTEGALPQAKADLLFTALDFQKTPDKSRIKALVAADRAFQQADLPSDFGSFVAASQESQWYASQKRWIYAEQAGERLLKLYDELGFADPKLLARLHIYVGSAYLYGHDANQSDVAQNHFLAAAKAVAGFTPPDYPKEFLQAMAWDGAAVSMLSIHGKKGHGYDGLALFDKKYADKVKVCKKYKFDWVKMKEPISIKGVPDNVNTIGGVSVLFDVKPDGTTTNVRLGAEVPENRMGMGVVESIKKWKATNADKIPEKCRLNNVYTVGLNQIAHY